MNDKITKIIATILFVIFCVMIIAGAFGKIVGLKPVAESLAREGVGDYLKPLGAMEIIFTVLLIYPKTFRLGFILFCCYFGGAIATHLSHGEPFFQPAVPLVLLWITAFLKDRKIFLGKKELFKRVPA